MAETITIQSGDTLSQLAQKHGTTVTKLMEVNPQITNPDLIYAGHSLALPTIPTVAPTMPDTFLQETPHEIPSIEPDVDDTMRYVDSALATATGTGIDEEFLRSQMERFAQERGVLTDQITDMQKKMAELGKVDLAAQYRELIQEFGGGEALAKMQELSPKVAAAQSELMATQQRKLAELDRLDQTHGPGVFKEARARQIQREYAVIEAGQAIKLEALASQLQAWQGNYDTARGMAMDMANLAASQMQMQYNVLNTLMTQQTSFYNSLREDERMFITDMRDHYYREADLQRERTQNVANLYIRAIENGVDLGWTPAMIEDFMASDAGVNQARADYGTKLAAQPAAPEFLSVAEAEKLGVPYGTTRAQAMGMGITPTKPEKLALFWSREDMDREQPPVWFDEIYRKITNMPPDTSIAPPMYKKVWDQYRYQVIREGWTIPSPAAQQALELEGLDWRVPSERRKALEHLHKREILLYGPGN